MSNVLRRSLVKRSLSYSLQYQTSRFFSISKHYFNKEAEEQAEELTVQLSSKRIQDVVAEFEKPLIDPYSNKDDESDPYTLLIQSVEKFKPRTEIISAADMEKLRTQLGNSYNVSQLRSILGAHKYNLKSKGLKKLQLINIIIGNYWGIKTTEQIKEEAILRQLDTIKQSFPASRHELFFIIGDNGNTIRNIERENQVRVNIDVINTQYIVEGLSADVAKAKKEIKSHLDILQEVVDVPEYVKENQDLQSEIANALVDISKVAGTFISLEDNKFTLASLSTESMENAKRLLCLMLKELDMLDKKELLQSTIVHNHAEFTVLPLHDSTSMSLYNRKLKWNRLESQERKNEEDIFQVLGGQEIGSMDNIKDILLNSFNQSALDNVSFEARFGNLLFQQQNTTSKSNIINCSATSELLYKNRTLFFPTMPPRQLTSPFIPLTSDGGFHQRSVQLEYINKLVLEGDNSNNNEMDLKRMNVEFLIDESSGDISLKSVTGIKNQSVIDMLGVHGNVDIRLLASHTVDFSNNEELKSFLLDSCKLTSYSELNAPKSHSINNESSMILSDITFLNKKRFLVDNNNLVSVNHIEQQDSKTRRTELMVNSVDPETLNITKAVERWSSFVQSIRNIAKKWDYST